MTSQLVLVTGATGAVGPAVIAALCTAGYAVRALSIDMPPEGAFPPGVDSRIGDIMDTAALSAAMAGAGAVVHMAALLHNTRCTPEMEARYEQVNVGGTARVLEAAVRAGVRSVAFFSTITVYGRSHGAVLTEESRTCPETLYAKTKLAAENLVLQAKSSDGRKIGTVLRLGAVYGPWLKGNYRRLLAAMARGKFVPIGDGRNRRSLIYDRDAAQAAVLSLQREDAAGQVFNVTDGRFHAMNEIIAAMCRALGRTPPRVALPAAPVRLLAGVVEDVCRLAGRAAPVGRDTVDKYTEDIAVSGERLRQALGFAPSCDLEAGWRDTVRALKRRGEI